MSHRCESNEASSSVDHLDELDDDDVDCDHEDMDIDVENSDEDETFQCRSRPSPEAHPFSRLFVSSMTYRSSSPALGRSRSPLTHTQDTDLQSPLSPIPPPRSPSESRSRSPLNRTQDTDLQSSVVEGSHTVIGIYDENGVMLDSQLPNDEYITDEIYTPDAHVLFWETRQRGYADDGNADMNEGDGIEGDLGADDGRRTNVRVNNSRSARGNRMRGGRRGREYSVRRGGVRRRSMWDYGNPLQEIWTSDADVPPELINLAKDDKRRREERMGASMRRAARTNERKRNRRGDESESEHEELRDATGGSDTSLLQGEDLQFEWFPMDSFRGEEEPFTVERTGAVESYTSEYDAFRTYWDDNILQKIVDETNWYATQISSKSAAFASQWFPTNVHEILCLFAFWIMLGVIRMPTIKSCFSNNPILKTDVFRKLFSSSRYKNLVRALYFNHSTTGGSDASLDRVYSLRPIIKHLNDKFQEKYVLDKNICIDESLTLWKGRLDFKQYMPLKSAKFGVKTFELCESTTGYLWSFIIYTGKQNDLDLGDNPRVLKSTAVVKSLINPLLNKGYRLFMDNWYNSPLLARWLKKNRTDCVGTVRSSRRDMPPIINLAPLSRGQLVARHCGDICVLSWQDKNRVNMITTCHGSATACKKVESKPSPNQPLPFKPQAVLDYNKFMGGVDRKDQMLEPYLIERKRGGNWCMKLFKRLLNVSVLNSRILLESSSRARREHLDFRVAIADAVITNHLSLCPSRRITCTWPSTSSSPSKVNNTHWPVRMPQTAADLASNRQCRRRCVFCVSQGRKYQKTSFKCESCNVPLCVEDCMKAYHLR